MHKSRSHCVGSEWPLERIKLDIAVSIENVCTAKQLADCLIQVAYATIQWKSLMRLFDIHAPPELDVNRSISDSYCSAVSALSFRAMSHATTHSVTSKADPWTKSQNQSSHGASKQCSAWGNSLRSSEQESATPGDSWQEVCQEKKQATHTL